jgi:hypothetical protein
MSKAKICGAITVLIAILTTVLNLLGGDVTEELEPAAEPAAVEAVEPAVEEESEPAVEEDEDAVPEPL